MDDYSGAVTVIWSDGGEVEARANLVTGVDGWSGRLVGEPQWWHDHFGEEATVRLPNGRAGTVLLDWQTTGGVLSDAAEVLGTGPAPFGD